MIRLSRVGKKKQPTYRIIIQDKTRDPWGKALEILGNYNPHTKAIAINQERLNYWRGVGAQMSATVNNLLIKKQIITGTRTKTQKVMAALKKKEDEKSKQETEAKAKTAATAKITEEEEAKAAEESPAEEPKAEEPVTPAEKVKEEAPESESAGK